jgi:hypothetical protein
MRSVEGRHEAPLNLVTKALKTKIAQAGSNAVPAIPELADNKHYRSLYADKTGHCPITNFIARSSSYAP